MSKLNLLPTELVPKASVIKLATVLKKLLTVFAIILVFFLLGVIAMFIFNTTQIKKLNTQKEDLISKVKALEMTEKQLVLVKDRISKIKKVRAFGSAYDNALSVNNLIFDTVGSVNYGNVDISAKSVSLQATSSNSSGVAKFLAYLAASDLFKSVTIKSLSFNPIEGYTMELVMTQ